MTRNKNEWGSARAGFLAVVLLALTGCHGRAQGAVGTPRPQTRPAGQVARARWDPAYWKGALDHTFTDHQRWSREVMLALQWRASDDDYWRLVRLLLNHAPDADELALLEHWTAGQKEHYSFALLVGKAGRYWCYTSDPAPPLYRPAVQRTEPLPAQWGEARAAAEARSFFQVLDRRDVWSTQPPRAIPVGLGTAPVAPWLLHAYRRDGDRAVSFVVDGHYSPITFPVVAGEKPLAELPRTEDPAVIESRRAKPDLYREGEFVQGNVEYTERFAESYPARIVLNGLLRVVRAEGDAAAREKAGRNGAPADAGARAAGLMRAVNTRADAGR
jgi:hypothetical protein